MKHILPILTAALALTATTASAAGAFDEYSDVYGYYSSKAYDSYQVEPGTLTQTIDYGKYQVIKTAYASDESLTYQSRFRIHVNGTKDDLVDFYLYDFYDSPNGTYNKSSLANQGITNVGYRMLDSDLAPIGDGEITSLGKGEQETVIKPALNEWNDPTKFTRNKYFLGTFSGGSDFEIYMSRSDVAGSGVWSYSSVNDQVAGYMGGDGAIDDILYLNVDKMMMVYQAGQNFSCDTSDPELIKKAAAAMPLAFLSPTGGGVSFGIQSTTHQGGGTVGSPLPGGVQIALIAGLFGLGFWYIRRRKSAVA